MKITSHEESRIVFIHPAGDVDGKSAPDFKDQVLARIEPEGRIVLDMTGVSFMSSAGLRSMLLIYREAKGKAARIVLVGVNSDIRGSMSATGFLNFFTLNDRVEDAVATLA